MRHGFEDVFLMFSVGDISCLEGAVFNGLPITQLREQLRNSKGCSLQFEIRHKH